MKYTDENLMGIIEKLFQKVRQQTFGENDRRRSGEYNGAVRKHEGLSEEREAPRRPILARERILRLISENEPISQVKLAAYLSIRPQSISDTLMKLERDGYISRSKNEKDKREILVSLTEEGKQRCTEVQAARTNQLSDFLAPLTPEERERLFSLIKKLVGVEDE